MKIIKKLKPKIVIFTAVKYCSILHGHVFVMTSNTENHVRESMGQVADGKAPDETKMKSFKSKLSQSLTPDPPACN